MWNYSLEMNKASTPRFGADVVMQPCPQVLRGSEGFAESFAPGGVLQRVEAVLRASILGECWTPWEDTRLDLATQSVESILSLPRLCLITRRIQLSPPSWRKWIFSYCLWLIPMDMCIRKPK